MASHEAYEAAQLLMDGLSTLNGSLRVRDGRNDWMRDFSAALAGYFLLMRFSFVFSSLLRDAQLAVQRALFSLRCCCGRFANHAPFSHLPPCRDFAKLSRLLLALEKNLPWKAMKEGFEKARPDFLARLAAVTTPAQAVCVHALDEPLVASRVLRVCKACVCKACV